VSAAILHVGHHHRHLSRQLHSVAPPRPGHGGHAIRRSGTIPLGAATAGALATAFGIRTAMWALAILFAVTPLPLLATSMRTMRDFPTLP
jgi:hypothetical protein